MNVKARPLKDGRPAWLLEWRAGKDPATGRPRRLYETFRGSKREAERYWTAKQAEIDRAGRGYVEPANETLGDYLDRWLRDYGPNLKPTTLASYASLAHTHVIPALGAVSLRDLTAVDVSGWESDMLRKPSGRGKTAEHPEGRTLSPKRVLNAHRMLHTALQEAVRLGLLATNPLDRVRPPKQAPHKVGPLTLEQVHAVTEAARGHRLEALFAMAWQTGLRLGELLGLRWSDVDLDSGTAAVRQTAATTGGPVFMQDPKSEHSARTLALAPLTVAALKAHRKRQSEERLKAGERWADHGLIFATSRGTPMQPPAAERTWHTVREKAGVPWCGIHALRHTWASLGLSAGLPLEAVAENLGHANLSFTKRTYAEYLMDAKREAAARFGSFVEKAAAKAVAADERQKDGKSRRARCEIQQ